MVEGSWVSNTNIEKLNLVIFCLSISKIRGID